MALPTSVPMKLKKFDVQAPPPERQRSNCQVLDEASSPFSQELIKALYVTLLLVGSGLAGSGFEICRILMRVSSSNASALRDSTACGLGLRPCLLVIREALGFLGFGIRGFPSRNSSALAPRLPPPACQPPPPSPSLPGSSVGSKKDNCRQENTCHEPFERDVKISERRGPARKGLGNRTKRDRESGKQGQIARKELENRRKKSNLFEGTREREKEERTARKGVENLKQRTNPSTRTGESEEERTDRQATENLRKRSDPFEKDSRTRESEKGKRIDRKGLENLRKRGAPFERDWGI